MNFYYSSFICSIYIIINIIKINNLNLFRKKNKNTPVKLVTVFERSEVEDCFVVDVFCIFYNVDYRHNEQLHSTILVDMVEEERGKGRLRMSYISQLIKDATVDSHKNLKE